MRPGRRWPRYCHHVRIVATSRPETRKPSAYKPRHPEKTPFFAVLYQYYDKFKAAYDGSNNELASGGFLVSAIASGRSLSLCRGAHYYEQP